MKRLLIALVVALAAVSFTAPAWAGCGYRGGYGYGYRAYRPYVARPYYYGGFYRPYTYYRPSIGYGYGYYGGYGGYGYPYYRFGW
jgi:hypothetical protein